MALTTEQKASFLFKQAQGVAETSILKDFFEESLKGRILVLNNQLWSASDQIPATAPVLADGAASGVVRYYQARTMNAVAGVSNSFYLEDLKDSIPFNFGDGSYNYVITSSTGTAIPFGQGDWLVNNTTGTLTFYGSVPANMPPKISFYKYIGAKGAGGEAALPAVYVVTTIAERDALTPKQGDLCVVTSANETYAWSGTSWVLIQSAGAVSSVNGQTGIVNLTASSVNAIDMTQKGIANGVATLDATGLVPLSQLPSTVAGVTSVNGQTGDVNLTASSVNAIDMTEKGFANGVATLDATGLVPLSQLPTITATTGTLVHPVITSTFEYGKNSASLTGINNTAIGSSSGINITTGAANTFFGSVAGNATTIGSSNTFIGYSAGSASTSNDSNTAIGANTLSSLTSGQGNIALGSGSGAGITTGSFNTFINLTGNISNYSGVVAIGRDSSGTSPTISANNQFVLGVANHSYILPGTVKSVLKVAGSLSSTPGQIQLYENSANGTDNVIISAPASITTGYTLTLPFYSPSTNDVLYNSGSGVLSWGRFLSTSNGGTISAATTINATFTLGPIGTSAGQAGIARFGELAANGSNFVALKAPDSIATDVTWTLPSADGTSGQVLSTNGSGTLSWTTAGGSLDPSQPVTTSGYILNSSGINTQTSSYILQASDNGRIVLMNSASAVNLTVPSGLNVGFNCMIIQIGAGQVTIVASGVTLNNTNGLKIAGQYGTASVIQYQSNIFAVSGYTTN